MKWKDDADRVAIYRNARHQYEREILELTEYFAELDSPAEIVFEKVNTASPDQLLNALLLVVSHFEGGEEFFEKLSILEQTMVRFQILLVLHNSEEVASSASHKGEADESLSDSQDTNPA